MSFTNKPPNKAKRPTQKCSRQWGPKRAWELPRQSGSSEAALGTLRQPEEYWGTREACWGPRRQPRWHRGSLVRDTEENLGEIVAIPVCGTLRQLGGGETGGVEAGGALRPQRSGPKAAGVGVGGGIPKQERGKNQTVLVWRRTDPKGVALLWGVAFLE